MGKGQVPIPARIPMHKRLENFGTISFLAHPIECGE